MDFQPLVQDSDYFAKHLSGLKTLRIRLPEFSNEMSLLSQSYVLVLEIKV